MRDAGDAKDAEDAFLEPFLEERFQTSEELQ